MSWVMDSVNSWEVYANDMQEDLRVRMCER